jgi:hypothetical protein
MIGPKHPNKRKYFITNVAIGMIAFKLVVIENSINLVLNYLEKTPINKKFSMYFSLA